MKTPVDILRNTLVLAIATLALAGCGTSAILDKTAKDPGADDSILILKINPANYRVMLFPGVFENGAFRQSIWGVAEINGMPQDGYIVAKAKAGQTLGLTYILEKHGESVFNITPFSACGGAQALAFDVPKARVVYLADIEFERVGNRLSIQYRQNPEAALAHLRSHYPDIKADIEPIELRILPTAMKCEGGGTVVIPMYFKK